MLDESGDDRHTVQKRQTVTLPTWLAYTAARMQSTENLIASYAAQAGELELAIAATSADIIARQPGENRWSVLQIVNHLADAELLASVRIRRIITQDRTELWSYQQEVWADRLSYQQRKIKTIVARFVLLRHENAELLSGIPNDWWELTGEHNEYGTLSLRQLIQDYIGHTAKHLEQIRRAFSEPGNQQNQ